jgi:hypothetical protein
MTTIESEKITIDCPQSLIFSFLGDFNHFEQLMPEQVVNWTSNTDTCSFTIKGMTDISLRITDRVPLSKIAIVKDNKVGFDMQMNALLEAKNQHLTEVQLVIHAKLNPFQSMLITTPLTNFLNILVNRLKEICERQV